MFQFDKPQLNQSAVRSAPAQAQTDQFGLWLSRVWRAKLWIGVCAVLAVGAALAFNFLVKPSYEASSLIYIDPQDLQVLPNDINARGATGDSGAMFVQSQARILQSGELFRDVVVKLGLQAYPEFASKVQGPDPTGDMALQGAIDNLSAAVRIVQADRTYVVEIFARSESPQRAAAIANAIVDSYLVIRDIQRARLADATASAIERRLDELRQELAGKEQAVDQFKIANGIVAANGQTLIEARLNDANTAVSAAQLAMNEAKARLEQLDVARSDALMLLSSPDALASPDLQRLRGEYEQAAAALQSDASMYGAKHPSVIRAQAQMNAVSRSISATASRLWTAAKLQYDTAVANYNEAVKALGALTVEYQSTDGALVQLRLLEQEVASSRAVYEDALLRSRQTREQQQINTANVQVISPATAPVQKRFPPKLTVLIPLALAAGMALGAGLGVLWQLSGLRRARKAVNAPQKTATPVSIRPATQKSGLRRLAALGSGNSNGRVA